MSYSIARVAKVKGGVNTTGIQKHVQRENGYYNNKDIDHDKTALNYDLIHGKDKQDYKALIEKRIEEGYQGQRKIRNDAVKHVDGIITSDNAFFQDLIPEQQKQYFQDSLEFLEKEYGKDNMLYATVHLDESTPHMHFGVVPITEDGRLSAKEVVGNKKALTAFQDRYNQFMREKGFELERGESKMVTAAKHEDMDKYKQSTNIYQKHLEETQDKSQQVEKELQEKEQQLSAIASSLEPQEQIQYKPEKEREVKDKVFGKAEVTEKETGNVVLTPNQLKALSDRLNAAYTIKKDYDRLKNTDLAKENQQLQKSNDALAEDYQKEMKEHSSTINQNKALEKENKELKNKVNDLSTSLSAFYATTKKHAKDKFKTIIDQVKVYSEKHNLKSVEQLDKQVKRKERQKEQNKGMSL